MADKTLEFLMKAQVPHTMDAKTLRDSCGDSNFPWLAAQMRRVHTFRPLVMQTED